MRWDENAGSDDDAISTSSRPSEQESIDQQGNDGGEGTVSASRWARAEVISMASDMSNNTSLI